jgi:hypothetical protein
VPAAIISSTKLDLISRALILCGEKPLISESDARYGATVGVNLFEMLYENELQSNTRWRFAMRKGMLARLVDTPLNEWTYAYQLPPDMLLPVGVFPSVPYEIYGDRLYTDATTVELDYVFKPEVGDCPAYFHTLMTYALAKNMIKPITESDTAVRIMENKYNQQLARAMYADAQGRPNKMIVSSPFVEVRS